jgi:hypothetical protein
VPRTTFGVLGLEGLQFVFGTPSDKYLVNFGFFLQLAKLPAIRWAMIGLAADAE